MQHQASDVTGVRCGLWTETADIEACRVLDLGMLQALAVLSPTLSTSPEAGFDEAVARAARFDLTAAERMAEMLQHLSNRLRNGLTRAQLEMRIEQAIVEAADALPERSALIPQSLRRAAG